MCNSVKKQEADNINSCVPRLVVKGFSCLKDITIDFNRLVVFIGEQASGKSVTCKLYYFFTQAVQRVAHTCLREEADVEMFLKKLREEFCVIFPTSTWHNDTFAIEWWFAERRMQISHARNRKYPIIHLLDYADRYVNALESLRKFKKEKANRMNQPWHVYRYAKDAMSAEFPSLSVDYVPAGRSYFSTIQDVIFSLLVQNIGIDYFLKDFGQKLEMIRREYNSLMDGMWGRRDAFKAIGGRASLEKLYKEVIRGKYEFDGKRQWIVFDKNHRIELSAASSGQQEALPLLLLLTGFILLMDRDSKMNRVIIEEPEAHLYPTAQQTIIDFLGQLLMSDTSVGCIITTHSPFILCCINNVLRSSPKLADQISAYHLHAGVVENIVDSELSMINARRFDNVSFEIANA